MVKKSKALLAEEQRWIGKKVRYYLFTLYRDNRLEGPLFGVVEGVGENSADIEDGVEGLTFRNRSTPNGTLIIINDETGMDHRAPTMHCEIIK